MRHGDNNPTIEQTTTEGHQQVFNAARNSRSRRSFDIFADNKKK